ncbi:MULTISPECIES: hypothetical protein [Mycobacteroides]|uniref:hypothetical protein n=1 Tax=Mycobacteroides TaxID=670516 RepID=UPI0008A8CA55|nr:MULTISPECIES: hypothetical protein [Mycobacteroides]AYM40337.1 hypothetical protein DYE20_01140 [[Mycobacterium] chelonae subsp. gwanakae]OHU15922.1 hypothetical protein BKG75_12805 [Mycobacteroides chelonae]SIF25700.1 Uncharacterised protein [Mycobacteroides abscessus subsp. abscessus]SIF38871.1 Uncharacterised protein [Mycobacteroides abscessus subsp. abscessus]SIF83478.1 Uncharacterised protein [Mycobacteroides abscessus subsp. abscessus]
MNAADQNDFDNDWIDNPTPEQVAAMPPVRIITDDEIVPARSPYADDAVDYDDLGEPLLDDRSTPAQPRLGELRFDVPELSESITPNRMFELVPTDPRMRGWRRYDRKKAIAPQLYPEARTQGWDETWHGGRLVLVWEHPVTGELRRCAAAPLEPWVDPWAADNERVLTEIKRRMWGSGWSYTDSFWTENIKPVDAPPRRRTLPAQYPMSTRRSRIRDWWWRVTHRPIDAEIVEQRALPAGNTATSSWTSSADIEGDWS